MHRPDGNALRPAIVVVVGFTAAFFHLANPTVAFGVFGGLGRSPMSNVLAVAGLGLMVAGAGSKAIPTTTSAFCCG